MSESIDAVLPLRARDLARARILLSSLRCHARGLGTLWVVTPPSERASVRAELAKFDAPWTSAVLSETELAPELRHARYFRGWHRQQLVKLAIAERVASAHYLTLDADVICTRRVTPGDLTPGGKGLCHIAPDLHADWYRHSAAVLDLTLRQPRVSHNVTPAVLNRAAVLELRAYLGARAVAGRYRRDFTGVVQRALTYFTRLSRRAYEPWRLYLITGAPWTEYALYYTFLEATGRFDAYHSLSSAALYSTEHSVWRADAEHFDAWDPRPLFEGAGPPYFVVVQSITQLSSERVWAKVAPFLR